MLVVAASSSALVRTIAVAVIKMDAVISSSGSICSQFLRGGNLIGPSTLTDCLDSDGNLDADKCHRLLSEEADFVALHHAESAAAFAKHILEDDEDDYDDRGPPAPKKRRGERGALFYADADGVRIVLPPTESSWYNLHIDDPSLDLPRFHLKFRKRFRMPHASFLELVETGNNNDRFARWKDGKKDAVGNPCAPLALLFLAALRCLRRAWTFDDLE